MSESPFLTFVGIDVSSAKLDATWLNGSEWVKRKIGNTWSEVQNFAAELSTTLPNCCCIVEYTGTYSSKIVFALCQASVKVSIITPAQSKSFATMKHRTTKNDKADARLLAEYGALNAAELMFYSPPSEEQLQFRQLLNTIEQLEKMLQQVRNQRHAYEQLPPKHQQKAILDTYQNTENHLDKQITDLNETLKTFDDRDEDLDNTRQLMTTVKGVGAKTANVILAKTNGIKKFQNHKQLAKFAGIAPTEKTSGSSVRGWRSINRSGNSSIRKALYCATWSSLRSNNACKALFDRLRAKGKPVKVALIAVANLILRQIFAVVITQKPFDNDHYLKKCAPA